MFKTMRKIALICISPIALLGACCFWMLDPFHLSAPKDAELISIFEKNKVIFEELRDLAAQDGEPIIIPSKINAKIPSARQAHYDSLLSKIGNPTLISGSDRIKWEYASGGMQTTGSEWVKGLATT